MEGSRRAKRLEGELPACSAQLPALEELFLEGHPLGDEGLAALVAPPPPAGAPPPPTGGQKKLELLSLGFTQIADAGCAALASALESGALPALKRLFLFEISASAAAKAAVYEARANLTGSIKIQYQY